MYSKSNDASGVAITYLVEYNGVGGIANEIQTNGTGIANYEPIIYQYNNGLVSTVVGGVATGLTHTETWSYDGKLVTQINSTDEYDAGANSHTDKSSISFQYDGNQLSSYTKVSSKNFVETGVYKYVLGNVVSCTISTLSQNGTIPTVSTNTFSGYDSKNSPYLLEGQGLGNQVFIPSPDAPLVSSISKNNYTVAMIGATTYKLRYSYNESNYPTSIVTENTFNLTESTQTFSYQGCK